MTETIIDAGAGIVKCEHRKMAIIGAGPDRTNAPWSDTTFCFQALNEIRQNHYARHWELHPRAVQSERDLAFLRRCPAPCYVLDPDEWDGLIPHPVRFPLDRIKAAGLRTEYLTCTFAAQIMLALADGFATIGLWGVELHLGSPRERFVERACVEYWLGVADGRGVEVVNRSGLSRQPYVYGYDYHDELAWVERDLAALRRAMDGAGTPVVTSGDASSCAACGQTFALQRDLCPACAAAVLASQ